MSISRGRLAAIATACALAAMLVAAMAATTAFAVLPAEPAEESPASLIVLNGTLSGNTYTVDARRSLTIVLQVGGSGYETELARNRTPAGVARLLCPAPTYAGVYVSLGSATVLPESDEWRPSGSNAARTAGPTQWFNTNGRVASVGTRGDCSPPGSVLADQGVLNANGTFLLTLTANVCTQEGDNWLIGNGTGPRGEPVRYRIASGARSNLWHLFSIAAFGTIAEDLEQIRNVVFSNLPNPSAAC